MWKEVRASIPNIEKGKMATLITVAGILLSFMIIAYSPILQENNEIWKSCALTNKTMCQSFTEIKLTSFGQTYSEMINSQLSIYSTTVVLIILSMFFLTIAYLSTANGIVCRVLGLIGMGFLIFGIVMVYFLFSGSADISLVWNNMFVLILSGIALVIAANLFLELAGRIKKKK